MDFPRTETHILTLFAALLCLAGCKGKSQAPPPAPPIVEVAAVTQADVPLYHEWIEIVHREQPFIYTYAVERVVAVRNRFGNVFPAPGPG